MTESGPSRSATMACTSATAPDMVVAMSMPRLTASLLILVPSPRELWPLGVLMRKEILPSAIRSRTLGEPSEMVLTTSQGMPAARSVLAVPRVASRS